MEPENGLVNIEQSLNGMVSHLPTMTPEKIAVIYGEKMNEVDRVNKTLGRSQTQHTNQLLTLNMLGLSPFRVMRQCLAQIEKKRRAIEDIYFKNAKLEVRIEKWEAKDDRLSRILIQEARFKAERFKMYIDGALKEIGIFQDAMEDVRVANNIPDDWDEKDVEEAESTHHLHQALRQAHRDVMVSGRVSQGNAEWLEQAGCHLSTVTVMIQRYIATCNRMIEEGQYPNIEHFYEWLDSMVNTFKDEYKMVMRRTGLSTIIRDEYLYLEEGNDGSN